MLIGLYIASGLLLCIGLFFALLHPFVCIFECALSKKLSGGKKAVWIILTLLTGAIGSLLYSIFGTSSRKLRRFSVNLLAIGLACLVLCIGITTTSPEAREKLSSFDLSSSGMQTAMSETLGSAGMDEIENMDAFESSMKQLEESMKELESLSTSMENMPDFGASTEENNLAEDELDAGTVEEAYLSEEALAEEARWESTPEVDPSVELAGDAASEVDSAFAFGDGPDDLSEIPADAFGEQESDAASLASDYPTTGMESDIAAQSPPETPNISEQGDQPENTGERDINGLAQKPASEGSTVPQAASSASPSAQSSSVNARVEVPPAAPQAQTLSRQYVSAPTAQGTYSQQPGSFQQQNYQQQYYQSPAYAPNAGYAAPSNRPVNRYRTQSIPVPSYYSPTHVKNRYTNR